MRDLEAQLLALEKQHSAGVPSATQSHGLLGQLSVLKEDIHALKKEHGGCVSAVPGELCEHCVSVVKVRLHMILENDRRNQRMLKYKA